MLSDHNLTESVSPAQAPALDAQAVGAASPVTGNRFVGKTVLVTGASDRGIGGAIAERLAREGASVAMIGLSEPKRLRKILARLDHPAFWRSCDITKAAEVQDAVEATVDEYGKIDIVVNNAGVEFASPLEEISDSHWRSLLEVNLHGAIQVTRTALPRITAPGGVIVNIASALAIAGCEGFSVYSASKAGLIGFTQSLAWELAPRGVRVVAVAPGLVHTPMIHKYVVAMSLEERLRVKSLHPVGISTPHDIADAVAFLASEEARRITGIALPIGWTPHFPVPMEAYMQ